MPFGRLERSAKPPPMSDINMTPLIDVMLVLLVIFMVTAPLMGSSLRLDLPEAHAAAPGEAPDVVAVAPDARSGLFLDAAPVAADALRAHLVAVAGRNPQAEVQLRADKAVPYGQVAALIDTVQGAGLTRIGFATVPAAPATEPADTPTPTPTSAPTTAPAPATPEGTSR